MPEAIPTPFDIVAIPFMPWIPGTTTWTAALGAVAALLFLAWIAQRPKSTQHQEGRLLSALLKDLQALSDQRGALYQDRVLHLATRIVCTLKGHEWAALSSSELRQRCASCADGAEQKIIICLAELHETLCQPNIQGRRESIDALIRELVMSLAIVLRERRGV
jgi:hypothetical protein